jgi:hypothetical protein
MTVNIIPIHTLISGYGSTVTASSITSITSSNIFTNISTNYTSGYCTFSSNAIIVMNRANGTTLLTVHNDGLVEWAGDIDVDKASIAFASSLSIGVERAVGITTLKKQQLRDAVFEEIISMAKSKGSLTADDLTFLHQSAKIMDKLSGII